MVLGGPVKFETYGELVGIWGGKPQLMRVMFIGCLKR